MSRAGDGAIGPHGSRWVYNDWVNNMQAMANPPTQVWTPAAVEAYLHVPNERTNAYRAGFRINLRGHSANDDRLLSDLSAIYTRLSEMISLAQTGTSAVQNRRVRIIQRTVRDIILDALPQAPHAGVHGPKPIHAQSDQDVIKLLPKLSAITNRVAKVFHQHFVTPDSAPYTPDCIS